MLVENISGSDNGGGGVISDGDDGCERWLSQVEGMREDRVSFIFAPYEKMINMC